MNEPKKDRHFLEAVLEGAEAAVDLATSSEVIKAVPVIGTAIKLLRGIDDMRSRMLQAKLARFLDEPALRSAAEARTVRTGLLEDDEHDIEMGHTIFMVIDKVTDMTKPSLLAKVFAAYLDDEIERDVVFMLAHAIDVSSVIDLKQMILADGDDIGNETLWRERLSATGLLHIYISSALTDSNVLQGLSPLGASFLAVIKHCERS